MTLAEVEAVVGCPPGDYGHGKIFGTSYHGAITHMYMGSHLLGIGAAPDPSEILWIGEGIVICVELDEAETVSRVSWCSIHRSRPETLMEKIRRWTGL
jgi:hypothetical protein